MLLAETGKKYSVNDLVLKAIAKCMTQHPEILVSFDEANHQIIQRQAREYRYGRGSGRPV